MSESNQGATPETDSLDHLSARVARALEQDAQRRRWVTRTFMLLALVPIAAAGLMFVLGRSEVEQTQRLVQDQTRNLEAQVSQKVTASVASELEGAREIRGLLPELKVAAQVAPLALENQRTLSEYRMHVDSALQRQDDLARSIQDASRRTDKAELQAATALSKVDKTTQTLERRVNLAEGKIAQVEGMNKSIASIRGDLHNTRKDMNLQMKRQFAALSAPLRDVRRIVGIEKQLNSMSALSGSLERLEAKVAQLPTKPVINNTSVSNVNSISRQLARINQRLSVLERGRKMPDLSNLEQVVRSLHGRIDEVNRSMKALDLRLKKLEPTVYKIEKLNPQILRPGIVYPRVR